MNPKIEYKILEKTSKKGNTYTGLFVVIGEFEKMICFLNDSDLNRIKGSK